MIGQEPEALSGDHIIEEGDIKGVHIQMHIAINPSANIDVDCVTADVGDVTIFGSDNFNRVMISSDLTRLGTANSRCPGADIDALMNFR